METAHLQMLNNATACILFRMEWLLLLKIFRPIGACPFAMNRAIRRGQLGTKTEQYGFMVPCIHMRGDGLAMMLYGISIVDKYFISPGNIAVGVRYNTDGNIF
ncbi:hypothetical protein NOK60_06030 [Escherichia coli]|uniref:hypothetical protein n=1 Tax=Escherichia coli TaxID=562 RepID=UPI002874AA0D|nr:hypothetical protein [Escherichia coli]MDS0559047.1 hypothetical protein [Escherichia coli]